MLQVKNVSKSYDGKTIISDISFTVAEKEKVAIIGSNGIGKSTLIRLIDGIEEVDSGKIQKDNIDLIGFFRQEFKIDEEQQTVIEFVKNYIGIQGLEKRLHLLEETMGDDPEKIQEYFDIQEKYIHLDGYNFDYKLETILNGFGLAQNVSKKNISELSGGQKNKVMLTAVLLKGADLLLLDEPTNNLDLKSIIWLEKYLQSIDTPCIIVSHDRRFLNSVTTKTLEIDYFSRTVREYPGNYEKYQEFKQKEQEKQLQKYEEQQETISNLRDSMVQKKNWATKGRKQGVKDNDKYTRGYERDRSSSLASNAKKIEKQIEKMDKIDKPNIEPKLEIRIDVGNTKSGTDIVVSDLICGYSKGFQTEAINFECELGDRIVIVGNNGSGKSTFLKTLIGKQKALSGEISLGAGLNIGYIAQDTKEDKEISIESYLKKSIDYENLENKSMIYTILKQFNFDYSEKDKKYKNLSPGERTRLQLAVFSLKKINALILDEPTNHLDIEALEALEKVIANFKGTVIAISHDREFIFKVKPTQILKFEGGKVEKIDLEILNIKSNKFV